ncbi:MAG: alpha/beta hydrolase [bacterium]
MAETMIFWPVVVAVCLFLLACATVYFHQTRLVFHPTRELVVTPDQLGLNYEDVHIEVTPGQRVHGWYLRTGGKQAPVVLFCHGNAGNISHRLETADLILDLGADILLFDYRGYGQSDGTPGEQKVYADAEACYRRLVEDEAVPPEKIVLFGRSLGGAVAVELARRVKCRGLIVESSFTSTADMGRLIFPWLPIRYLLRHHFDSIKKISTVDCPVLVTHSPDDELVPFEMGRQLYAAAKQPKRFVSLRGGHNEREYFLNSSYTSALRDIIHGKP